jgi:biotin carboxylase
MSPSIGQHQAAQPSVLVIGCGFRLLDGLAQHLPSGSVLVAEHTQLVDRRKLHERVADLPVVAGLLPTTAVAAPDPRDLLELPGVDGVRCVLPGTDEQSAITSAVLATTLGLPGAGRRAAETFADKLLLREAARAAGLRQPRWCEVRDAGELACAVRELGVEHVVLKPSGRSGSQGVLLLDRCDDLEEAWAQSVSAPGRVRVEPPPPTRYLVEERLHGPEVSVECLVEDGAIGFANVTAKRVLPGRHPVETGHALPAQVGARAERALLASMATLVASSGFGTGVLHGEWILLPDGPALVECAARIPGDRITDLLTLAYGVSFVGAYADLMSGGRGPAGLAVLPGAARQAAAISFLTPPPGTVDAVVVPEGLGKLPGVVAVSVDVAAGDVVNEATASADRSGWVQAVGPDAGAALACATRAADSIQVVTR